MVGDTMETDILGGIQMGYRTVLSCLRAAPSDRIRPMSYTPSVVADSVADLVEGVTVRSLSAA